MATVTLTRCAGGGHVTLTVTGEKGDVRTIALDWADLVSEEHDVAIVRKLGLPVSDAALIHDARAAIREADAKDEAAVRQAVEGKAYEEVKESADTIGAGDIGVKR